MTMLDLFDTPLLGGLSLQNDILSPGKKSLSLRTSMRLIFLPSAFSNGRGSGSPVPMAGITTSSVAASRPLIPCQLGSLLSETEPHSSPVLPRTISSRRCSSAMIPARVLAGTRIDPSSNMLWVFRSGPKLRCISAAGQRRVSSAPGSHCHHALFIICPTRRGIAGSIASRR